MEHLDLQRLSDKFRPENLIDKYTTSSICSFWTFPGRNGWEVDQVSGTITRDLNNIFPLDFPTLMQSWLFFGLITAVVYDDGNLTDRRFDSTLFQDRQFVSTRKLKGVLEAWQRWEVQKKQENDPKQKLRMIRAQLVLDLARTVVRKQFSMENLRGTQIRGPTYIDDSLALSLMVLGETLSNAKACILKRIGFEVHGWSGDPSMGWGTPRAVVIKMRKEGWCPRTIKLLKSQLPQNATALLSVFSLHEDDHFDGHGEKQAGCTEDECKVKSEHPKHKDEYATRHHPDCYHLEDDGVIKPCWSPTSVTAQDDPLKIMCQRTEGAPENRRFQDFEKANRDNKMDPTITCYTPCDAMIGPVIEKVIELIDHDKIPLLKFKEDTKIENDIELDVTDTSRETEYATISHVWSDGYGNDRFNELYRCQLEYLRRLLREAHGHRTRNRKGPRSGSLAFWMDTLIIPVQDIETHKAARRKAIHQIYNVFSKAQYTIVVDSGLNRMDWDHENYTSTAMRILASGWMRRLWTLQEAFLSRKLMFAFKGSANRAYKQLPLVDLDEIEDLYDEADDGLISNLPAIARSYYSNMLGPDRKARINKSRPADGKSLIASVWRAAQWRTTEHKEHETLALATLLNLDMKRSKPSFATADLLKETDDEVKKRDEMMRDFWTLLEDSSPGAIPPGIIFLAGPRNAEPGFGWAPRSWMTADGADYPDPITIATKPARLLPNNKGLEVEYPGFLLHYEDRSAIVPVTHGQGFWFPSDNSLTEIYHVARADSRPSNAQRGIVGDNEDLAVILCRLRPGQIPEVGLLVKIVETKEEKPLGQDGVKKVFAAHLLFRVKVKRETKDDILNREKGKVLERRGPNHESVVIFGEALAVNQKWYVDCRIITEVEQDGGSEGGSEGGSHRTALEQPSREVPMLVSSETDTPSRFTSRPSEDVIDDDITPIAIGRNMANTIVDAFSRPARRTTEGNDDQGEPHETRIRKTNTWKENHKHWSDTFPSLGDYFGTK